MGKTLGKFNGARMCIGPNREESQFFSLFGADSSKFPATVSDLHHEQPGKPVEVLFAVVIPNIGAVTFDNDGHVAALVI